MEQQVVRRSTKDIRGYVYVLRKRKAWLDARIAIAGPRLSFDRHESASLNFALQCITELYPDTADIEYDGGGHYKKHVSERPIETPLQTEGLVANERS